VKLRFRHLAKSQVGLGRQLYY